MTDPGLSSRLRQHSRRAGLMVGISMALTVAICVGGFATIYAALTPFTADLVPQEREPTPAPTRVAARSEDLGAAPTSAPEVAIAAEAPTPTPAPAPTEAPAPTPTEEAFRPTHQISAGQSINFRSGPSTADPILFALPPLTPLQYLNEDAPTQNPAQDGRRWMRFRNEDGEEGWVREIDTEPYRP